MQLRGGRATGIADTGFGNPTTLEVKGTSLLCIYLF